MAHLHEKVDFTAEVFIVFQNKVLLRRHDKYNIWLSVGGHIELDEDPLQAARREVQEEVGLDVEFIGKPIRVSNEGEHGYHELLPPRFMNRHHITATHDHVTLTYFAVASTDTVRNQENEHSDALKWFTAAELLEQQYGIRDSVRQYAQAALEAVNE